MTTQFAPFSEALPTPLVTSLATPMVAPKAPSAPGLAAFGLRSQVDHIDETAGSWKLSTGHAVTLQDAHAAVLRITHGRVWATVDGPHAGPANNQGDVVMQAGQRLTVSAGQRVVIEPWRAKSPTAANNSDAVYFSWDPAPLAVPHQTRSATRQRALQNGALREDSRWQLAVVCPLRDLGLALVQAAQALGRLVWGVAGLLGSVGNAVTAGRGRVQPCMESNPP